MCFCCGSRVGTAITGIYALIEALIWLLLSILGLVAYNCKISIQQDFPSIIYYIYFYNEKCAGPPQFLVDYLFTTPPGYTGTVPSDFTIPPNLTIPTIWPDVVEPSQRTQQWVLVYIILSGIWAFTSLILTIGSCVGCKGFNALWYYLPWVLTTLAVIVSDTVASIIYGLDIVKTESFVDLMNFIGVKDPDGNLVDRINDELGEKSSFAPIPSVVMVVIFSRGVILWIINVAVFLQVFVAMLKVMKHKRHGTASQRRRKDSTESDEGWGWSIGRSTKRSVKSVGGRHKSAAAAAAAAAEERRAREQADEDENNRDFLRILSNHNEVRSSLRENGMPPTELRSQLPWSYFSSRDEPARPPKPTNLTREPMPPVPPPDYTLRFPQANRPSLPGQNLQHQVSRSSSHNDSSVGRRDSQNQPHGKDLAGATPVFPSAIGQEFPSRRLPPRVPEKPTNLRMFSPTVNPNWSRRGPEVPQGPKAPFSIHNGGPQPAIPEPDYNMPVTVPVIPYPDYSNPVPGSGERERAAWRQKPLHAAPHVITKTPFNQGRDNASGYY